MKHLITFACTLLFAPAGFAQTLVVTPSKLTFTTTADLASLPPPQAIQVTSPNGNVAFSVYVVPRALFGGPPKDPVYLAANPASGITPATVTVSLLPVVLSWGYGGYYNTIGIGTADGGGAPVTVDLLVNLPPPPVVTSMLNATSLQSGISPGAIVSIFGEHLGPPSGAVGFASSPSFEDPTHFYQTKFVGNTKVAFNGFLAPLLYANATQVNAVVPYEVAGQASVEVVLSHSLVAAPAVTVPVLDTSPGIFTVTQNGSGQGAILNQNRTLNSTQNPAAAGSIIQIFATGAGLWNPTVPTGLQLSPIPPFPVPAADVAVAIGGQPAQITYAGGAPGFVSGLLQVNAVIPAGLASGPQPVVVTIGQNSNSRQQVTVAVQ